MPEWWPRLLLGVFATHLPYFSWRWMRTGEARYAATTLTFSLLVATYALRVFAPELQVGHMALYSEVRVVAWLSAAVSIGLLLQNLARSRRP